MIHDPVLVSWSRHMVAEGLSEATRKVRVGTVRAVARHATVEPVQLAAAHVVAYLTARDYAPWTRRKYLEHLRAFARWAGIDDPTAGLRPPPQPRGVPRPISEPDLARLIAAADGPERAWVLLGAYAGLRSAEMATVAATDIVDGLAGRMLRVAGKGGHVDVLPLAPIVDDELQAWLPWSRWSDEGRFWHVSAHTVQQRIRRLGASVDVDVTSHQLRHRFGTMLYRQSRDLLTVQRLMRHSSPQVTAVYVQLDDSWARQMTLQLPGADGRLVCAVGGAAA